uniref:Uncharacterized protein n=1 Tax=Avena sativa TaxID=4498 RepID=A0ACD5XPD4_AVESA
MPLTEEERRLRRMASNRLSARRSRAKRQQQGLDLAAYAAQLAVNNEAMRATTGVVRQNYDLVEQANRVLEADARHLYSELERRNAQLRLLGQITRVPMDVPDIPAHLTQLYGGLQEPLPLPPPAPPLSYSSLPLLPPSLSPPLQTPPNLSLPLPLDIEIEMLFQPEPGQSDDVMDDAASLPWL